MEHMRYYVNAADLCDGWWTSSLAIRTRYYPEKIRGTQSFCKNEFRNVKNHIQRCTSRKIIWNEEEREEKLVFVVIVQVYIDKPATNKNANATLAYPFHVAVLSNTTLAFQLILVGLDSTFRWAASCMHNDRWPTWMKKSWKRHNVEQLFISLYDAMAFNMERFGKNTKLQELHEAMQNLVQPVNEGVCPVLLVCDWGKKRKCHPSLISLSYDISVETYMSGSKHGRTINAFIRCLKSVHDVHDLKARPTRTTHVMDEAFQCYKQ